MYPELARSTLSKNEYVRALNFTGLSRIISRSSGVCVDSFGDLDKIFGFLIVRFCLELLMFKGYYTLRLYPHPIFKKLLRFQYFWL